MRTYGKRKILFTTSIEEDKLIVDVLTENKDFRRFLKTNANNGPYLVRWYKEKKDRFETFEKEKCRSDFQVFSQAHSFFGLLIKDNIKYFNQNKVEYRGIDNPKNNDRFNVQQRKMAFEKEGIVSKHNLVKDVEKAIIVARIIYTRFYESKEGIFGRTDMPEELLPESVKRGSYYHLMFITLTASIDYQRDAEQLWKAGRHTIDDKNTRWIYSPEEVLKRTDAELVDAMQKHRLSKKPIKDALQIWKPVCKSFYELFDSDPRNLLKECNYDALKIFESIKLKYKRYFPYLSGKKILPLWIRMMNDVVGINLKNLSEIPLPVDVHITRATFCLGCLKGKYTGNIDHISREIDEVWKHACESLPYYRLQLDEPLWHLSKYGCTKRRGSYCIKSAECPVAQYCVPGKVYVSPNRVEIDT